MRRTLSFLAAVTLVGSLASAAYAADPATQCRDASGKYVKCATNTGGKCRDAAGKYVKCGTPGAMPEKSAAQSATGNASNTAAKAPTSKSTTTKSTTTTGPQPEATSPK